MNSKKYQNVDYEVRDIRDLRELINSCAELYGESPAFLVKDEPGGKYRPISHREWNIDVNALGTCFVNRGLKGKKIAVVGENSYEWVVTYFATVNGCGVIVPIDRELEEAETQNLLERARVSAIIHSGKVADKINKIVPRLKNIEFVADISLGPGEKPKHLEEGDDVPRFAWYDLLEEGKRLVSEGNRDFIEADIDREAMCTLLFTSGTTGMAKGVMLSHKNLAANVVATSHYVKIIDTKVGLSVLPMHHTYEMSCHVMTGLYQGIAIAICEGLKYITKNMQEAQATVMLSVPLIFEAIHKRIFKQAQNAGKLDKLRRGIALSKKYKLYNKPWITKRMFKDVHKTFGNHMTLFIAGGAAIDPKVIEDFEAMGIPMIQGYGMTESSPIIALNRDRCSKAAAGGNPLPGTEVKIVDPDEEGNGEIWCRSDSVMIGYFENEEATREVLDEDGWLDTGDIGYIDDEGYVYITGRQKSVIITKNGKNVFPEEIEYYLGLSDFITEALVHAVPDRRGDSVVKAEILPNFDNIVEETGRHLDEDELIAFIKNEVERVNSLMPLYKRVRRFSIRHKDFDKTTTRKIKRYNEENLTSEGKETSC
jgi:long-chain acyl-CoA synthetase